VTYRELDARANRLAHHLLAETKGSTGRVGILVERSLDMLVALLATLKAGCSYVPLDPHHPQGRLRHILAGAEVSALVTDGMADASLVPAGTPLIDLGRDRPAIDAAPATAPASSRSSDQIAYVIYTSGSTGAPKGVEIPHRAVVNLLSSMARKPGMGAGDTLLAVTTISFDIAGLELFLPLIVGGTVAIASRAETTDGDKLLARLRSAEATIMQATPASWRLLLEAGFEAAPGFKMLCGGEALPRELASRLLQGGGALWNMYGPTETTIWSSCVQVLPGDEPITVGTPIANTQFHILDQNDLPVPVGVSGELHIGGDGVARGYFKNAALTREKFIADPFGGAPGRLYRTGDFARRLPNGEIQILGRMDHQIKLRGFRIELGEIEAVLSRTGGLAASAVALREDEPGNPQLVGYVVERPGEPRSAAELRAALSQDLPDYMIPSAWVRLEALPLSPNGKLDRAALPRPDAAADRAGEFTAPETPLEKALAAIWAEVLQIDRVGTTDDFFSLGADSIHLFQITARANRNGIRLAAKQVLKYRTIAALVPHLEHGEISAGSGSAPPPLPLGDFKRMRLPRKAVGSGDGGSS
jgi:amino acid adenylation domain-containing protein